MKLNLISNGRSNPKTNKSNKESDKYLTFILHLRPINKKNMSIPGRGKM